MLLMLLYEKTTTKIVRLCRETSMQVKRKKLGTRLIKCKMGKICRKYIIERECCNWVLS
jgi:hypothetical protein